MAVKKTIDQLGFELNFSFPPRRIISLVPSQTELLYDLGLREEVVGITKFCIYPPEWHLGKPKVGGTKNFDFDKIDQLQPDLIIGNKEENYLNGIEVLRAKYPVWMSDIKDLEDALNMITGIGELVDKKEKAGWLKEEIVSSFHKIKPSTPKKCLYLIWRKPWMAAGPATFINSMLQTIGLSNCVTDFRYPELTNAQIQELNPEVVLLSTEPFPFSEKHIDELQSLLPNATVQIVDGEFFSWYGSRMKLAPEYFNSLRF